MANGRGGRPRTGKVRRELQAAARATRAARRRLRGRRSRADVVLAQGTGRAVATPFGSASRPFRGQRGGSLRGWDAFDSIHTPLPRATGPYAVVRTTTLISSDNAYIQFGVSKRASTDRWTNIIALASVNEITFIDAAANTQIYDIPVPGGGSLDSGLTVVPAALSVQLMNPNSLQETTGILFATVCHAQLDLNNRGQTWQDLSNEVLSYMRPRLLSAGKLALRGVQMNAFPLNMSAIADFRPIDDIPSGTTTLTGSSLLQEGFSPIIVSNPTRIPLKFLVSVEWRVRFDISNPAVASHVHHGVTPDNTWNSMMQRAVSMGNGVADIVEKVANVGMAAEQAAKYLPFSV